VPEPTGQAPTSAESYGRRVKSNSRTATAAEAIAAKLPNSFIINRAYNTHSWRGHHVGRGRIGLGYVARSVDVIVSGEDVRSRWRRAAKGTERPNWREVRRNCFNSRGEPILRCPSDDVKSTHARRFRSWPRKIRDLAD